MSVQRKRGQSAIIYKSTAKEDLRGNTVRSADLSTPFPVIAAFIPQRSSRAEVPGQQVIDVYTMLLSPSYTDVDVWSRVKWNGDEWDLVSPPTLHFGTRRTKHISITIRRRPYQEA